MHTYKQLTMTVLSIQLLGTWSKLHDYLNLLSSIVKWNFSKIIPRIDVYIWVMHEVFHYIKSTPPVVSWKKDIDYDHN